MKKIEVKHCHQADFEHAQSIRQYAHTFHRPGNVICVAKAFWDLPYHHQLGLYIHEVGHLLAPNEKDELMVDRIGSQYFGVPIYRIDSPYGKNLETV